MTLANKLIQNTFYLYIRTVVSLVVNILTTRILLEALGQSGYGLYNVVAGSVAMLGFLNASMSSTTQRFISHAEGSGEKKRINAIFNNSLIIHYGLAIITGLVLLFAAVFLFNGILSIPEGSQTEALIVYGCMIVTTFYAITIVPYDAEITAHEDMLVYSVLGIVDVLSKLGISILVYYSSTEHLIFYAVLMAIESALLRVITKTYAKKKYDECRQIALRKEFDKGLIKEMISFAGWNLGSVVTTMISAYGMSLVLNHYFGVIMNAALGVAIQLQGVLMGVSNNLIKAITPVLVKSEGGNNRKLMLQINNEGCKLSFLLISFIGIPVCFFCPNILRLWLKNVPDLTSVFCQILIISSIIEQITLLLNQSIMAEGRIRSYSFTASIINILPIAISVFMFQKFHFAPYWVTINWLIWKVILTTIQRIAYAKKNLGLSIACFIKDVIKPCISVSCCIIVFAIGINFLSDKYFDEIWYVLFLVLLIISLGLTWMIGLDTTEKNIIKNVINRFVSHGKYS